MLNRRVIHLTAAAMFLGLCSSASADILIAVAGPMTGATAAFGDQMKKGVSAAVADINAAGGVLGEKIVMEIGDDACDPKQAVAVANQLAGKRAKLVVGHYCSSSSIPASEVYEESGIIQISPGSTNPALTDKGRYNVFRVCGRDDQQGRIAGDYFIKHFKNKKIAILHDKSTGGKGLADEMRKRINEVGLKEVLYDAYNPGEKDYSAVISRLKSINAEAIFIGGYYTEVGLIQRQSADQGYSPIVMSGDSLMTNEFWGITGPTGEGALMTFSPDPRKNPEAASVIAALRKANIEPEGYVLYAYGAVQAWAEAVKRAGSTDAKKVSAQLKTGSYPTVIGKVEFDAKGDNKAPGFVVYRWSKGSYEYADAM